MGDKSPKSKQKNQSQKNTREAASEKEKQRVADHQQAVKIGGAKKK